MRTLVVAAVVLALARGAAADPIPPGAIGVLFGLTGGTGAARQRIGIGYYEFGGEASWQPSSPLRRWGFTARVSTLFGTSPQKWFFMSGTNASAAQVEDLHTLQLDATVGLRVRPSANQSRFLTFRVGAEALRTNQPIPPENQRAFVRAITSIGLDQYIAGTALLSVDVRYGVVGVGGGPDQIALIAGIGVIGP
jgi:hypothetical protein